MAHPGRSIAVELGETMSDGAWVYISTSDGKAYKADITDEAKQAFGIVLIGGSSGATAVVYPSGEYDTTGLTAGAFYYLSATAGVPTTTRGSGDYQYLGKAMSTTRFVVEPARFVTASGGSLTGITATLRAGETLTAGQFIYVGASGYAYKADANDVAKMAVGFVLAGITSGTTGTVYFEGINDQLSGLTAGTKYYLSATAGGVTDAATALAGAAGDIVQYVGTATGTTTIPFKFSTPTVL